VEKCSESRPSAYKDRHVVSITKVPRERDGTYLKFDLVLELRRMFSMPDGHVHQGLLYEQEYARDRGVHQRIEFLAEIMREGEITWRSCWRTCFNRLISTRSQDCTHTEVKSVTSIT
jgi:hypothetical protein